MRGMHEVDNNYVKLVDVFWLAYDRAAFGKGQKRHGEDKPFDQQDICSELRTFGPGPALYQIRKKAKEVLRLSQEAQKNELLDIIVYAAATWIVLNEEGDKDANKV